MAPFSRRYCIRRLVPLFITLHVFPICSLDAFLVPDVRLRRTQGLNQRQSYIRAEKEKKLTADTDLLKSLDDSFTYDGRLEGSSFADFRCGFVTVMGAPNMGKSTLLNALLEEDLCIATARPQTTRHAILGLMSTDKCQVCLVDTPGVIEDPAYELQEGMMEAVTGAVATSDVLLVVTDVFSTPIPDDELFLKVQRTRKPVLVAINKIDLAKKVNKAAEENRDKTVTVEEAVAFWRAQLPNALCILPLSASQGINNVGVVAMRRILTGGPDVPSAIRAMGRPIPGMFLGDTQFVTDDACRELLPISPPLYDPETLTDRPERFIASEIVRSALFQVLKKELPYCCEVRIREFKEPKEEGEVIRIAADVLVERDSQKVIVIGKNGAQVKEIGVIAREKLEAFFRHQIFLNLSVKVDKDWRKNTRKLTEYGYMKPKR